MQKNWMQCCRSLWFSILFSQLRVTFSPNFFYIPFISKPFSIITRFI